jgi:alpha-ketoglutarate-dependent taurine dioxygenase
LQIQKGDMQFFNNFVVLHSRTEYQDDADHRRHLVRLWLEDPRSKRRGESLLDLYVPGSSRFHAVE